MKNFSENVLRVVKKIKKGEFKTYQEVARLADNSKAIRAVGNILAENRNLKIPCYRVIKNDNLVGGFYGNKNFDWKKAGMLLGDGVIGVIPTDTIYGICGSVFNEASVEKVYKLRKRNPKKPAIVLIENIFDLKKIGVKISSSQKKFLSEVWPGKVSVILKCANKKFDYLHRGTKTIAFRMSKNKELIKILKISGPLIAPSANFEGKTPAKNIKEAKKYFSNKVFYFDRGDLISKSSKLIDLTGKIPKILRP